MAFKALGEGVPHPLSALSHTTLSFCGPITLGLPNSMAVCLCILVPTPRDLPKNSYPSFKFHLKGPLLYEIFPGLQMANLHTLCSYGMGLS